MAGTDTTVEVLEQRLDRLERENRRLKRAGTLVLLGMAAVVLIGQAGPSKVATVVQAERFVLRDASGKIRAELGVAPDGRARLALFDRDGKARAGLAVEADGIPALSLYDRDEKARARLAVLAVGGAALGLVDRDGKARAMLAVLASGTPDLSLYDRDGKVTWSTP